LAVLFLAISTLTGCVIPQDCRGDETVCPVHGTPLKSETKQIQYGLVRQRLDYMAVRDKLFPEANTTVPGGCTTGLFDPIFATIRYCPDCREAEKQWLAEHPRDEGAGAR
jgi:hypothetical protein